MKFLTILYFSLLVSISMFASEVQGEKIVLVSFQTYDEATSKLKELELKITQDERNLREKYHFDIVARPSGKAYIVAIEPIASSDDVKVVLKHFQKNFPDAYTSHYYGPTQGTIKLAGLSPSRAVEVNNTKVKKSPLSSKAAEMVVEEESQKSGDYGWLWVPALLLIIIGGFIFVWRGLRGQSEEEEVIDESEEVAVQGKEARVNLPKIEPSVELDIFYRFTKNIFFLEILQKLKEACDARDAQEMVRWMNEVEKYQKNFRRSSMIATMSRLTNKEGFDELSRILEKEIK